MLTLKRARQSTSTGSEHHILIGDEYTETPTYAGGTIIISHSRNKKLECESGLKENMENCEMRITSEKIQAIHPN